MLKYSSVSEMNNPSLEPELCRYLLSKRIRVSEFIPSCDGKFISTDENGRVFHLQKFVEGKVYEWNTAPDWLLEASACELGKIHSALKSYSGLPVGIGAGFFAHMTPANAQFSYQRSLQTAMQHGDAEIAADLEYRIGLMRRFPAWTFDLNRLTCQSTHGDYFISQLICGENAINAVIDWTTACVHPIVWEIIRSYAYAAPCCAEGKIDIGQFIRYVQSYLRYAPLGKYDIAMMPKLFFDQIAVCDYYGQYYGSTAGNRNIYLSQAVFSTRLMRWFEAYLDELTDALCASCV